MKRQRPAGLGINPGHGYVKVVLIADNQEPTVLTMPAIISQAQQQLVGAIRHIKNVGFGNDDWWVGDDALIGQRSRTALNQDRIRDPVFIPVLVRGAIQRLDQNGHGLPIEDLAAEAFCVSGLPATWSVDRDLAHALVQRLRAAAKLGKVKVIAEPLGLLYAALLDNNGEIAGDEVLQGGKVAVVDLGHHTVDVAVMQRMVPEPDSLATYQLGTSRPLHILQQRLAAAFDLELPLYRVDQAVRTGVLRAGGVDEPLPHGWEQLLADNGRTIVAKLVEAWGSGRQFDTILIGGGGAEVPAIVDAIRSRFRQAQVIPNGQIAVALGYARLARLLAQRATRP